MSDTARIRIHMSADEVARLDEIRGEGTSRSAFVRTILAELSELEPSAVSAYKCAARSPNSSVVFSA